MKQMYGPHVFLMLQSFVGFEDKSISSLFSSWMKIVCICVTQITLHVVLQSSHVKLRADIGQFNSLTVFREE